MKTKCYKVTHWQLVRALPAYECTSDTLPRLFSVSFQTATEAVDCLKGWEKSYGKFTYELNQIRQYDFTNNVLMISLSTEDLYSACKEELSSKLDAVNAKMAEADNKTMLLDLEKKTT